MQQINYNLINEYNIHKYPILSRTQDVVNMKCGETYILPVYKGNCGGFIIVEKYSGSNLKNVIRKYEFNQMNLLMKGFKVIIIGRENHLLFINSNKDIYFCDNLHKNGDKDIHYFEPIRIKGSYKNVIQETYYDIKGVQRPYEYYVLVYTKGNLYDGTRHFIPTRKLFVEEQIIIRKEQKKIIKTIQQMHQKSNEEEYKKIIYSMIETNPVIFNHILSLFILLTFTCFVVFCCWMHFSGFA
jgi:hypothetical protein